MPLHFDVQKKTYVVFLYVKQTSMLMMLWYMCQTGPSLAATGLLANRFGQLSECNFIYRPTHMSNGFWLRSVCKVWPCQIVIGSCNLQQNLTCHASADLRRRRTCSTASTECHLPENLRQAIMQGWIESSCGYTRTHELDTGLVRVKALRVQTYPHFTRKNHVCNSR